MRIALLSIAFLFLFLSAKAQVLKSAGVWYFLDVDSMTARPAVLPNGTELAYVVGTKKIYYWDRGLSAWTEYSTGGGSSFNRDSIYFDSSIVGSGTVSDPWGVDSTLFATIAAVGDSIAAALGYVAANYFPLQGGTLTGTGGNGFVGFPIQSSPPSTPATGFSLYAGSTGNNISWMQPDGFFRRLVSPTTGTPRQYQFMARSYTLGDSADIANNVTSIASNYIATSNGTSLVARNLFDNNTYAGVLNSKPWQFGQWTTAGRPTGTTGYTGYNTTGNGIEWYNGSRWAYTLESTFARGTAARIPFFDANGQIADNSGITFQNPGTIVGATYSSFRVSTSSTATANNQYQIGTSISSNNATGGFTGLKNYVAGFFSANTNGATIALGNDPSTGSVFHATITSDFLTRQLIFDSGNSGGNLIFKKAGTEFLNIGGTRLSYNGMILSSAIESLYGLNTSFHGQSSNSQFISFRDNTAGYKSAFGHDANGGAVLYAKRANTDFVSTDMKLRLSGSTGYAEFLNNTGGVLLGGGTTAQTPTEANGLIRYNSDSTLYQIYQGGARAYIATRAYVRSLPTIYSANGTATSNRTYSGANYTLDFNGVSKLGINSNRFNFSGNRLYTKNVDTTGANYWGNDAYSGLNTTKNGWWIRDSIPSGSQGMLHAQSARIGTISYSKGAQTYGGNDLVPYEAMFSGNSTTASKVYRHWYRDAYMHDVGTAQRNAYSEDVLIGRGFYSKADTSFTSKYDIQHRIDSTGDSGGEGNLNRSFIRLMTNAYGGSSSFRLQAGIAVGITGYSDIPSPSGVAQTGVVIGKQWLGGFGTFNGFYMPVRYNSTDFDDAHKYVILGETGKFWHNRVQFLNYGTGTKEATDLSKTQSNYIAGFATDGTVLDLEQKRDTTIYVDDADYDWSAALTTAQIARRYNRVIFWMTTTGGAGSDSEITLHTPDANLMQVEYLIHSVDEAGGFSNVIRFGTNNAVDSTNGLVSSYFPSAGDGIHIRAGLRSAAYKYRYSN